MGTGFYGSNDPTNSVKALKEDRSKGHAANAVSEVKSMSLAQGVSGRSSIVANSFSAKIDGNIA